jgi:hypothetical protein
VSHHRTGECNQYNGDQSRCAFKQFPGADECPCQLHRAAAAKSLPPTICTLEVQFVRGGPWLVVGTTYNVVDSQRADLAAFQWKILGILQAAPVHRHLRDGYYAAQVVFSLDTAPTPR